MSISSKQNPLTIPQGLSMPAIDAPAWDARSQSIKESGVVSKIQGVQAAGKILGLIEDYEGATPERLNAARYELIRGTHQMDQYPITYRGKTLDIINDYAGFDEVQADEIQESLSTRISDMPIDKFVEEGHFTPEEAIFVRDLGQSMQDKMASMIWAHSTSTAELSINTELQAELLSYIIDSTKQFVEGNMSRVPVEKREEYTKTLSELASTKKELTVKAYSAALEGAYSPQTILKLDRGHMTQLIRAIVQTQKKSAASLPPLVLKEGTSRSITYAIKKDGQMRGYLFGTAHYLNKIPGGKRLTKITKEVQARLYECAILGTEIRIPKEQITPSNSIDETLVECASSRTISNIGIDAEDRDDMMSSLVSEMQQAKDKGEEERYDELMFEAQALLHAVHDGDVEKVRATIEKRPLPSKKEVEFMSSRNIEMADNIDVLLNACAAVGDELGDKPPRAFFAVGAEHIVATKNDPNSVAELLAKKGWTVELLK